MFYVSDLSTDSRKPDNVTISPGEPLLLRCRKYHESSARWEHNNKPLEDSCPNNEVQNTDEAVIFVSLFAYEFQY